MPSLRSINLLTALLTVLSLMAQDPVPRQATADHCMPAADSVAVQDLSEQEDLTDPAGDLYPNWSNQGVGIYGGVPLPDEYKIDLRGFAMPTPSRLVTSGYGYRKRFRRQHHGLDIKVYVGDTIYAAFSGKVRMVSFERKGYGYYIVMRHPNGLETVYGHLSKQLVKEGQIIHAGEPIGLGGNTGRSYGSHLHFETRFLGLIIDPAILFDFPNQDVTADHYVVRRQGKNTLVGHHNPKAATDDLAATTPAKANAKANANAKATTKATTPAKAKANTNATIYKVREGDTLGAIARKHGTTVDRLCRLNGLKENSILRIGQIIKLP